MKRWMKGVGVVDVLYFGGGALVAVGAGMLLLPMGLIVAGGFLLAASILVDRAARAPGEGGEAK